MVLLNGKRNQQIKDCQFWLESGIVKIFDNQITDVIERTLKLVVQEDQYWIFEYNQWLWQQGIATDVYYVI